MGFRWMKDIGRVMKIESDLIALFGYDKKKARKISKELSVLEELKDVESKDVIFLYKYSDEDIKVLIQMMREVPHSGLSIKEYISFVKKEFPV